MKNRLKVLFGVVVISVVLPRNAFCYIDPGTGSFMLQILVATLLGAVYSIKLFWKKIISLVLIAKAFIVSKVI